MSSSSKPIVLILGGAGAQNGAVAKVLSNAGTYTIHVLTRSVTSAHAVELGALPNVKLIEGDCYNEEDLIAAFESGADLCFVNTNGFAVGEKNEIYWGIRMYELARWAGVKHFVYGGLPYVSMNGRFDPKARVPFVDGKGKVGRMNINFCSKSTKLLTHFRIPCFNAKQTYGLDHHILGTLCRTSLGIRQCPSQG